MSSEWLPPGADAFTAYYLEDTPIGGERSFLDYVETDPELECKQVIPYEPQNVYTTAHGVAYEHSEMVEQVLADEHEDADSAVFIPQDTFQDSPKRVYEILAAYAEPDRDVIMPGAADELYGSVDTVYGDPITGLSEDATTLILEEAMYTPVKEPGYENIDALQNMGDLDVAVLDVAEEPPTVKYVEVKSKASRGNATDAKDQLARFDSFAQALGWETELEMALFDKEDHELVWCRYLPGGNNR